MRAEKQRRTKLIVIISIITILVLTVLSTIVFAHTNSDITIHSINELNTTEHDLDSHGTTTDRSTLEVDFRSRQLLGADQLNTGLAHYPRLKTLADGSYIMFYNSGRTGPDIMYVTSGDLRSWSEPKTVFLNDGNFSYATADAVVLENGDIIVVAAKRTNSWGSFVTDMSSSSLVIKRSSDNGATWSNEEVIYTGMVWEPSIIQLTSGEIQVYFTQLAPYIVLYGYYDELRSTGSAMIRSLDGGVTWTPNVTSHNVDQSDPYSAWRVMQQKIGNMTVTELATGNQVSVPFFNDQMPVALQLNNGSIALVAESYIHFEDHPVNGGKYQLSIGFSHDNWQTPLGIQEEGPSDKLVNIDRAAGPYISQFRSGEVIVSHTNSSSYLEYKIFDSTAHSYERDFSYNPDVKNLWSASEVISSHKIAMVVDDGNNTAGVETQSLNISYAELALNHNISAKRQNTSLDANNVDWSENTEALFVGSSSQAQVSIRSAYDDTYVYFLLEVLDNYVSTSDKVEIAFATSNSSTSHYNVVVGPNGLVSKTYGYTVDVSAYVSGTIGSDSDTDIGYLVEFRMKKSDLANIGFNDALYVSPKLYNTDGQTTYATDIITGASISSQSKTLCPMITYTDVNKYDTVFVSNSGNDNAYGNTKDTAVKTLTRAVQSLNEGGTIIICDNITITENVHLITDSSNVNLRGLKGSETISVGYDIYLYSNFNIDSIKFKVTASNKFIYAQYNDLVIGNNVTCSKTSTTSLGITAGYYAQNANTSYADLCSDEDCYIEVNSGTWRYVRGGNRRNGTSAPLGHYSGDMTILINGGTFDATASKETEDVTSPTGMNSSSGNNVLIISGGNFSGAVYAQCRSGGIVTTSDGYTDNPDYSGTAKVVVAGGNITGGVKALQTVGYPTSNITYPYNTSLSVEYADGNLDSVVTDGFDSIQCFGGYAIPSASMPNSVEIGGLSVDFRYYGNKVYIPLDTVTNKAVTVIYTNEETNVYLADSATKSFTDLEMDRAFPKYIGTAIRTHGSAGLRFKSSLSIDNLPSAINIKSVGTIATFTSSLSSPTQLMLDTDKTGKSIAYDVDSLTEKWYEERDNGEKIFTAVLVNFNENEYDKKVTYRPYVIFEYNGDTYTLYGQCISRSILDVARQCTGNDSTYDFVQSIISTYYGIDNDLDHSFFE